MIGDFPYLFFDQEGSISFWKEGSLPSNGEVLPL